MTWVRTNTPVYTLAQVPVGPSLDLAPIVRADEQGIDLTVTATLTEFLGYDPPIRSRRVQVWKNGAKKTDRCPAPAIPRAPDAGASQNRRWADCAGCDLARPGHRSDSKAELAIGGSLRPKSATTRLPTLSGLPDPKTRPPRRPLARRHTPTRSCAFSLPVTRVRERKGLWQSRPLHRTLRGPYQYLQPVYSAASRHVHIE